MTRSLAFGGDNLRKRNEGDPGRDPRGHTITVAFMAWAPSKASCNAKAGDDAAEAEFHPVTRLPTMAFDHLKARRNTGDLDAVFR